MLWGGGGFPGVYILDMCSPFYRDLEEVLEVQVKVEFNLNDVRDSKGGLNYLYYVRGSDVENPCEFLYGVPNASGSGGGFKTRYFRWPNEAERGNYISNVTAYSCHVFTLAGVILY